MLDKFIEMVILWYQRSLSPIKGYRCAHDVLYCSGSCSNWALDVTRNNGALVMLGQLIKRLKSCKAASSYLSEHSKEENSEKSSGKECAKGDVAACCINLAPWS